MMIFAISLLSLPASIAIHASGQAAKTPSVTVPMLRTSAKTVTPVFQCTINGKAAGFVLDISQLSTLVFKGATGDDGESDAEVKLGAVSFGRLPVVDVAGSDVQGYADEGASAVLNLVALSGYQIGLDMRKGTLTLWKSADRKTLTTWCASSGMSKIPSLLAGRAASIPYESRGQLPIVIDQTSGGRQVALYLDSDSGFGGVMLPSAGPAITVSKARVGRAASDALMTLHAVAYNFPGGQTKGWTWLEAHSSPALSDLKIDGAVCIWWLDVSRLVIDPIRHEIDYTIESPASRFAIWLSTTTMLPLAASGDDVVLAPSRAPFWFFKTTGPQPPPDSVVKSIAGVEVSKLRKAFESRDQASGNFLVSFAEKVATKTVPLVLVSSAGPFDVDFTRN